MRTFSQYFAAISATLALKWTSATSGVMIPSALRAAEMLAIFSASPLPCVVRRTNSPPAAMIRLACATQATVSLVSVVVMDCTLMGAPPPICRLPTMVGVVRRLITLVLIPYFRKILVCFFNLTCQTRLIDLETLRHLTVGKG